MGVLYHSDTVLGLSDFGGMKAGVSTHEGACFEFIANIYC